MMDLFLDFVFIATTTLGLFFLYHRTKTDQEEYSSDEESSAQANDDNDDDEESTALLKKYIFSIRELRKHPNETNEDSGSMPSFESMLNPKRRCFSLSDLDSLNLINDQRIASDFNSALESVVSEPSIDVESERAETPGSLLSWDEIDSDC